MFSTVVLPAPFGPITLVILPGSAMKLTPVAALMPPNAMPTSEICSTRRSPLRLHDGGNVETRRISRARIDTPGEPGERTQHALRSDPKHHQQQSAEEQQTVFREA